MTKHITGTRKDWLAARVELLKAEKEHTRRGDELARQRQELPWVRIDSEQGLIKKSCLRCRFRGSPFDLLIERHELDAVS